MSETFDRSVEIARERAIAAIRLFESAKARASRIDMAIRLIEQRKPNGREYLPVDRSSLASAMIEFDAALRDLEAARANALEKLKPFRYRIRFEGLEYQGRPPRMLRCRPIRDNREEGRPTS